MKRLCYFFSVLLSLGGCRLDKTQALSAGLPATYGLYQEREFARVWDTLKIEEGASGQGELKVIQHTLIQRKRGGRYLKTEDSHRRLSASYDPVTRELYLIQRGKKYYVDPQLRFITDNTDTLYRAPRR